MRTTLNLAAKPFSNHRLIYVGIFAVLVVSLWLYGWTSSQRLLVTARANTLHTRVKDLQDQLDKVRRDKEKADRDQQQPPVTDLDRLELASARQLLERRAFSFNRLISDLERYVPKKARLVGLKLDKIAPPGEPVSASVEVKALGQTAAQMTEMMEAVEKSGGLLTIRQSTQDAIQENGEVPFSLVLIYNPARGEPQ
jgi:hypothetical protein